VRVEVFQRVLVTVFTTGDVQVVVWTLEVGRQVEDVLQEIAGLGVAVWLP
jgi:hypothetical protein